MGEYARPQARIHLNAFFPFGPIYRWNEVDRPERYYEFEGFAQLAQTAERGLFTAVFLGDSQRLREHLGRITDTAVTGRPDQLVLFAHLAALTSRIGLVATVNATYTDPVELARRIATLETLSHGRSGWNLVTTHNAWTGENFRRGGYLGHADRYRHALEYLQIVQGLWAGERVEHEGPFYRITAGPFAERHPQQQPVLFQAGESDEGRDFAAQHAEAIFSRYLDFDSALAFAQDLTRSPGPGPDPRAPAHLPGRADHPGRDRAGRPGTQRRVRAQYLERPAHPGRSGKCLGHRPVRLRRGRPATGDRSGDAGADGDARGGQQQRPAGGHRPGLAGSGRGQGVVDPSAGAAPEPGRWFRRHARRGGRPPGALRALRGDRRSEPGRERCAARFRRRGGAPGPRTAGTRRVSGGVRR